MSDMNKKAGADTARPVDSYVNEMVDGLALCADSIFEEKLAEVGRLRRRQADYLASLPTKADDCISAAVKILHHDSEEYPEGFEEALYLSFALEPMIRDLRTEDPGIERQALLYVADRVRWGLERASRKLDRVSDILCNPGRIEREERIARNCGLSGVDVAQRGLTAPD